jgi:hypothetical protein
VELAALEEMAEHLALVVQVVVVVDKLLFLNLEPLVHPVKEMPVETTLMAEIIHLAVVAVLVQ